MTTNVWRITVSILMICGIAFGCVTAYLFYEITRDRPLPFDYIDITEVGTYPRELCPGDRLTFDVAVVVNDAPSVVAVVANWQSVIDGQPAGTRPASSVLYFIQEEVKTTEATQGAEIPNLPPGQWIYERAGSVNGIDHPALLQIPFEVRSDCE